VASFVRVAAFCAASVLSFGAALAGGVGASQPIVVELFTSEGCDACPPADALLRELAARPGVVALAYHVDYWDYLGRADPLASPRNTLRQRDYAALFRSRAVYTPQMVVNGTTAFVGSRRDLAFGALSDASAAPRPRVAAELVREDGALVARVALEEGFAEELRVLAVRHAPAPMLRSIGDGRDDIRHDVVLDWRDLGLMTGGAARFAVEAPVAREGLVVLAQSARDGRILAAVRYAPTPVSDVLAAAEAPAAAAR
jgi:hypothetical protein